MPHLIRLGGPWQYRRPGEPADSAQRCTMPCDLSALLAGDSLGGDSSGRVLLTRRFNRPTNLTSHQRVELVIQHGSSLSRAWLNDTPLDPLDCSDDHLRYEITSLLSPHNRLTLETAAPPTTIGPVRLEIFTTE